MLDEKLYEYADTFGENFPIFYYRHKSEEDIIDMIDDCLKSNKPIDVDEVDGEV